MGNKVCVDRKCYVDCKDEENAGRRQECYDKKCWSSSSLSPPFSPICKKACLLKSTCLCPNGDFSCIIEQDCLQNCEITCRKCQRKQERFCPSLGKCTTKRKCLLSRTKRSTQNCHLGLVICHALDGKCVPKDKCPVDEKPECERGTVYCPSSKSCQKECLDENKEQEEIKGDSTEKECDRGQMYCESTQSCVEYGKCDVSLDKNTNREKMECEGDTVYFPAWEIVPINQAVKILIQVIVQRKNVIEVKYIVNQLKAV